MRLENNPQMVAMLDHAKGSLENKIRQAYNSGYNDGFKAGVFEAWDDMREQLDKSLRQQYDRKTENSSEIPNNCEDEPQTETSTNDEKLQLAVELKQTERIE